MQYTKPWHLFTCSGPPAQTWLFAVFAVQTLTIAGLQVVNEATYSSSL